MCICRVAHQRAQEDVHETVEGGVDGAAAQPLERLQHVRVHASHVQQQLVGFDVRPHAPPDARGLGWRGCTTGLPRQPCPLMFKSRGGNVECWVAWVRQKRLRWSGAVPELNKRVKG